MLQHGFIGAWGEGYYTDVFSTAGQAFTAQNWRDRAEVLQALLDALPSERMIQVRVPQQRQKFLQGPAAPTTTPPSAEPAAFGGSAAARVGFHNDCFLADDTDAGTFSDFEGATDAGVIARLRGYQAQESRFTVMGGETCVENGPADNCAASGGRADSDLELFHFSFLNQSYNANVNDDWVGQGCLDPIRQRLGYRLELVLSALPRQAQPGQVLPVTLAIRNTGFASPYNPRGAELILRSTNSAGRYFAELSRDYDARRWFPGTTQTLSATLALPADMPPGDYEALLHLPDPAPSLYGLVPYTIRLANADILTSDGTNLGPLWEPATGYHRLGHTLAIRGPAQAAGGSAAEVPVLPYSAIRETYDTWRARHFPGSTAAGDPAADPDADGWQNLFEYAVGTDPTAPSASPVVASWEEGRLVLTIPKGPGVKDVEYQLEGSAGLSPTAWSAAPVTVLTDDPRQVRARLDETGAHGFLRVRVTLRSP